MSASEELLAFAREALISALYELYDDPGGQDTDEKVREAHALYERLAQELGIDAQDCIAKQSTLHEIKRMQDILTVRE